MSKHTINRYEGKSGLLQVTLNSLNAEGEIYIFETSYASLNNILPQDEADEFRKKLMEKGIKSFELTNQAYHTPYTKIEGYHEKVMNIRYINPDKLKIKTEVLIYNDIVAIYSLEEPCYAIEIQDEDLANMQRQLFKFLWEQGERPILGPNSRSSIF